MKNLLQNFLSTILISLLSSTFAFAQVDYPNWCYEMKVWPFDVLYPFETGFSQINGEPQTSDEEIRDRLENTISEGANVVIFYIDDEQSYETFIDETGFTQTLNRIRFLVSEAHARNLKVICYVNGLEVISVGATTNQSLPTLARKYPDWLQIDITNNKMVWYTTEQTEWIPKNSEDAWASPLSPWFDLFKSRLTSLCETGIDGIYIDATFLPGLDSFGIKWASKDPYFQAEFQNSYNSLIPSQVDWNSETWRKFILFRHEVIRDYLGELADHIRSLGVMPFFESSSCDYNSGTFLGNDVPFTISGDIACSPEIEPEGDYLTAFRMSKSTRDANQDFPMLFLGWPENTDQARREFAITLCHSGNYYPTADSQPPSNGLTFMDLLREPVLDKRVPFQNTLLVYPMRSKDYTYENESTFDSYENAFTELIQNHIPFRIIPLETMSTFDLQDIDNVVLAGAESISDIEYDILKNKTISLVGKNGTKDEWGNLRSQQLSFVNTIDISSIKQNLPFTVQAPTTSYIEYYTDELNESHYFVFVYNNNKTGQTVIRDSTSMSAKIYELDNTPRNINGTEITIPIVDYLEVIDLQLSGTTKMEELDSNIPSEIKLDNYPNPFNPSTNIKYSIPNMAGQTIVGNEHARSSTNVTLKVYDILGHEVATLVNKQQKPGNYEVVFDASSLPSGMYMYRIKAGDFTKTKKMMLLK